MKKTIVRHRCASALILFLNASMQMAFGQLPVVTMDEDNQSWLNPNVWDNDTAPSADFDYILAEVGDNTMRTSPQGQVAQGVADFPGNSLTVPEGTRLLIKQSEETGSINSGQGDLILDGGQVVFGPNGGTNQRPVLDVADFLVMATSGSRLGIANSVRNGEKATLDGRLTGPGDLLLNVTDNGGVGTGILAISEVDETGYTGTLTISRGSIVEFGSDVHFRGGANLEILGAGVLRVNQALTFEAGKLSDPVNGVVPAGVYAGDDLAALGANYVDEGGSIEVLGASPEIAFEGIEVIKEGGVITQVDITFSGLEVNAFYFLDRGDDLQTFPVPVNCAFADEPVFVISDFNPPSDAGAKAFYQLTKSAGLVRK